MHAHAHPEIAVLGFLCKYPPEAQTLSRFTWFRNSFFDDWILEQEPQALLLVSWRGELYPHNTAKACPPGWHNKGACEMLKLPLTAVNYEQRGLGSKTECQISVKRGNASKEVTSAR